MSVRAILAVSAVVAVSACAGPGSPPVQDPVVRIGFGIGPSARATGVGTLAQLFYAEPLFGHDWSGVIKPRLVEAWEWNPQRTVLRFRLKSNVKFHDGTALTTDLVARFLTQLASRQTFGMENVTGVRAIDSQSVELTLSAPDFFLLPALNDAMVTHPDDPKVATGPFALVPQTSNVEVRRFEGYHEGRSALRGVTIQTFDTQRSAWAALMRGEVDVVQEVSRDLVEFIDGSSSVKSYPYVQPFYRVLAFNHRRSPFKDVEVRRAIAEAVDRPSIIQDAMRGRGRPAHDPIWPFHWAYPTDGPQYVFDPRRAAARLDKAGYELPAQAAGGQRRNRLRFRCLVYNEDSQFERIALLIQRQLFDIGVAMDIELISGDKLVERLKGGDFDAFLYQMYSGRAMNYTYRFWKSGTAEWQMINSGYSGADQAFDQLRTSISDDATRQAVRRLVEEFHSDTPAVFLAWNEVTRAVSTRFDVGGNPGQDPFFNMWQWRPREVSASQ